MSISYASDETCMSAYMNGDEHAFEQLWTSYAPLLERFFMRRGKRPADAQDLVQQTFLKLHRARGDYRAGELVRPWIFTIARNAGHDHGRRQLRRPETHCEVDTQPAPESADDDLLHSERTRVLAAALENLSHPQRRLLNEHWLEERSFAQIAKRDGVEPTTLRVRAHRACAQLRALVSVSGKCNPAAA
jgi:RNA polymerase sigma-70 factor (ECF subfamily)